MKRCLVLGAGGFIGWHLAKRLHEEENFVVGVDIKNPEFAPFIGDYFTLADLRDETNVVCNMRGDFDEVYCLCANMGGAGFVFTGEHDAEILNDNARMNLNVAKHADMAGRVFFSSSACVYGPDVTHFIEDNAYPARPDSEYGWEKLFSERVYLSQKSNNVRIARFHNIFGTHGSWTGGREKAPAATCRKVAMAKDGGEVMVWGSGKQVRSYLYIDDCIDGILAVMRGSFKGSYNVGSERPISINDLTEMTAKIAGKDIRIKNIEGPEGVQYRNSNNRKIEVDIGWKPKVSLEEGMERTYRWIYDQIKTCGLNELENMK